METEPKPSVRPETDPEGAAPESIAERAESSLERQLDELETLVCANPLAAVGVAAAAGLVLGLLLTGRR